MTINLDSGSTSVSEDGTRGGETRQSASPLARLLSLVLRYGMIAVLVALLIAAVILYPGFLKPANIRDILSQNAPVGIIAVGMTFVIIGAGFDLSVGSIYALGATVFAGLSIGHSVALAGAAALAVGLVLGSANGFLVARLNVNPFVATLGSSSVISGLAFIYSHSAPFVVKKPTFTTLGNSAVAGIPTPIVLLIIVVIVGSIVLSKTEYGRSIYALGGNWEASRLSGLRVRLLTASTYVMVGVLAVLAGMIDSSRLGVGQADVGGTVALDAIAIVVVGGTSLLGGEGAIWRTVVGLLILATLTNVFYSLNVSQNWQLIAKGLIVIAAVALDSVLRKRTSTVR